jgi:hypothetical protein
MLDPEMAVDAVEGEREDARADEDEQHEGRQRAVASIACFRRSKLRRRLAIARISAPERPSRRLPSAWRCRGRSCPRTRKISASGGIRTMMTCWASRDIRLKALERSSDGHEVDEDGPAIDAAQIGVFAVGFL